MRISDWSSDVCSSDLIVIDPEGDFVTLSERHGHIVIEASDYDEDEIARIAAHVRERRASAVLSLEGIEIDAQLRCAGAFLNALFDAPRDHWYPALVVVDERSEEHTSELQSLMR